MSADRDALQAFLRTRRSVRRFLPDPVSQETIHCILMTGIRAPSAHNRQPWRFVVITTAKNKERLAEKMGQDFRKDLLADGVPVEKADAQVKRSRDRICEAPVVVLLCLTMGVMDSYPDRTRQMHEYMMACQSVALAGGTILLAAHAEGLGGVWVCAPLFAQETVQKALDLPSDWEPQGMLLIGYPAVSPKERTRLPLDQVVKII